MTFKLQGNELVGQPEMELWEFPNSDSYNKYIDAIPKYRVLPEDIPYFSSKEVWEENEIEVRYQFKQTWTNEYFGSSETKHNWADCSEKAYKNYHAEIKRIIARPAKPKQEERQCEKNEPCSSQQSYEKEIMAGGVTCLGCGRSRPNVKYILAKQEESTTLQEPKDEFYPGKRYQRLFNYLHDGGFIALQSEMDDIINIVEEDFLTNT